MWPICKVRKHLEL